ncbi:hypothetical protein BJ912DRAFT_942292, partial [Pholiota molesta]
MLAHAPVLGAPVRTEDTSFLEEPSYDSPSESSILDYDCAGCREREVQTTAFTMTLSLSSLNSSYTTYDYSDLVYDRIIDALLALKPNPFLTTGPRNLVFIFDPAQHDHLKNESIPPLMIKRRLSFSHENGISGLSLAHPSSYMMDISSGSTLRVDNASSTGPSQLDRFKYPVHYYFVNFTKATRIPRQPIYPSSAPSSPGREFLSCSFKRDIHDCGIMFESLLPISEYLDKNTFESFAINVPSTPHAKEAMN